MEGFRDWLAGLTPRELAVYAVVGVGALAAAGVWYARASPAPLPVESGVAAGPRVAPTPSPAGLIVHVAGQVRRPGVYELAAGDRVIDALEAAGGPRTKAQLDALNLAAPLVDGQQVLVPRRGAPGEAPGSAGGGEVMGKLNLNTADASAFEELPGIGEVLAGRIVEFRERNGPFTSIDELINVSGIGEVTLEELRPLVTI